MRDAYSFFGYLSYDLKSSFVILLLLALVAALADLAMVVSLATFINFMVEGSGDHNSIIKKIIGKDLFSNYEVHIFLYTFIAIFASLLLKFAYILTVHKFTAKIGTYFSLLTFNKFMNLDYETIERESNSRLISVLSNKISSVSIGTFFPIFNILGQVTNFSVLLLGSLFVNPRITLIVLGILGPCYLAIYLFSNGVKGKWSQEIAKNLELIAKHASNSLGFNAHMKIRNIFYGFEKRLKIIDSGIRQSQAKLLVLATMPKHILEALAFCSLVLLFSNQLGLPLDLTLSSLVFVALVFQKMLPCLQQIYTSATTIKGHSKSAEDVLTILKFESSSNNERHNQSLVDIYVNSTVDKIIVSDLTHPYIIKSSHKSEKLNFELKKSDKVLVVAPSGHGKSTLLKLISGLYEPVTGEVSYVVSGANQTSCVKGKTVRQFVNYEIQNSDIYDGTLLENFTLNENSKLDDDDIFEACEIVELLDLFSAPPLSATYKKLASFSGGEKQRLAIARALLSKKSVMIFDETTSGLNVDMERRILSRIFEKFNDTIILIVSHRAENADLFTTVIDLEN